MLQHFEIMQNQLVLMFLNKVDKRNDIIKRQIIRRGMINDDSSINIPKSLNNFSDNGSRKAAGYYEKNNYINPSDSVSMVLSKLNNEEDGGMYISTNTITIFRLT